MIARRLVVAACLALVACATPPLPEVPPLTVARPTASTSLPIAAGEARPSAGDTVRALQVALMAKPGGAEIVRRLTSEVGARPSGSANDKAAVAWALAALGRQGLTEVHAESAKVPHWERGIERAEISADGKRPAEPLLVTALGGSQPTPPSGVEAHVVEVDSLAALDKLGQEAAGKIVFINQKMRRSRDGSGYGEAVGIRFQGPIKARAKGAVAVLIRSVGTDETAPHTGATSSDNPDRVVPVGALAGIDADKLHRAIAARKNTRARVTLTPKWLPEAESSNVVGDVPGREKNGQVVLLGAHLDSWDLGTGAIDDGAGCAIVMEAARAIAELPERPRRTIRVVLFASEEMGGGAREYARAHEADAGRTVLAIEADSGTEKVYATRFTGAAEARGRFDDLAAALAPLGIAKSDGDAFGGADVAPLRKLGVPTMDLEQDVSGYFDQHHTKNDTFEHIDKDGLAQAAAAFATVAWWAAEMEGDFGRVPEDKRTLKW